MAVLTRQLRQRLQVVLEDDQNRISETEPSQPQGGQPERETYWRHEDGPGPSTEEARGDDRRHEWGFYPVRTIAQTTESPIAYMFDKNSNMEERKTRREININSLRLPLEETGTVSRPVTQASEKRGGTSRTNVTEEETVAQAQGQFVHKLSKMVECGSTPEISMSFSSEEGDNQVAVSQSQKQYVQRTRNPETVPAPPWFTVQEPPSTDIGVRSATLRLNQLRQLQKLQLTAATTSVTEASTKPSVRFHPSFNLWEDDNGGRINQKYCNWCNNPGHTETGCHLFSSLIDDRQVAQPQNNHIQQNPKRPIPSSIPNPLMLHFSNPYYTQTAELGSQQPYLTGDRYTSDAREEGEGTRPVVRSQGNYHGFQQNQGYHYGQIEGPNEGAQWKNQNVRPVAPTRYNTGPYNHGYYGQEPPRDVNNRGGEGPPGEGTPRGEPGGSNGNQGRRVNKQPGQRPRQDNNSFENRGQPSGPPGDEPPGKGPGNDDSEEEEEPRGTRQSELPPWLQPGYFPPWYTTMPPPVPVITTPLLSTINLHPLRL
jgi:hypothetical protein